MTTGDTIVSDKAALWERIAHQTKQRNDAFEAAQNYTGVIGATARQLVLLTKLGVNDTETKGELTKIKAWAEAKRKGLLDYVSEIDQQNAELTAQANGDRE
jgi:hypothetical protein